MYDCKAPLSRFYYPDTRRIINAFIILLLLSFFKFFIRFTCLQMYVCNLAMYYILCIHMDLFV